jgi:hypothetical protein
VVNKGVMGGVIGAIIVAIIIIGFVAYNDSVHDDARLADLRATYFDDTDRLVVAVVLTNSDGEFTKANGHVKLTINRGTITVYSNEYDFTKNDFLTWDNLFLGKQRGVVFTIDKRFSSGDYDVYANLQTKSHYWEGLHARFYGEY